MWSDFYWTDGSALLTVLGKKERERDGIGLVFVRAFVPSGTAGVQSTLGIWIFCCCCTVRAQRGLPIGFRSGLESLGRIFLFTFAFITFLHRCC